MQYRSEEWLTNLDKRVKNFRPAAEGDPSALAVSQWMFYFVVWVC
jgi:hypothetical protein